MPGELARESPSRAHGITASKGSEREPLHRLWVTEKVRMSLRSNVAPRASRPVAGGSSGRPGPMGILHRAHRSDAARLPRVNLGSLRLKGWFSFHSMNQEFRLHVGCPHEQALPNSSVRSIGALLVGGFTLFVMLYVNGNFPANVAIGAAIALGTGVFFSLRPYRRSSGPSASVTR